MREPLDLNLSSITSKSIIPFKKLEVHGNKLLNISDCRKQLQYYNKHICSLSYSSNEGLHCFGNYDHWHGYGKMFFSKANPNNNPNFEIYLEERQKEINRLQSLVDKQETYFNKLKCFIEEKAGQLRFDELKVESNQWEKFMSNGGGTVPEHLWGNHSEIDLRPTSQDERKSYNQYLYNYVQQLIIEPQKFHLLVEQKYDPFSSGLAIEAFKQQVNRALNKDAAIKTELHRIEAKFYFNSLPNYIELLYPYEIKDLVLWQAALFNAFVNGYEFNYSRKELSVDEIEALIHVEQVFEYYKQVHKVNDPLEVGSTEEFLNFFEAAGEVIRPAKIEFYRDGSHKVTAWNIGKSIDELYKEKVEEIEKVVSKFKQKCYSNLSDQSLRLLDLTLKKIIRLFKDENNVFKDNPEYQHEINEQLNKAVSGLEGLLNDVVTPQIEFIDQKNQNAKKLQSEQTETEQPINEINTFCRSMPLSIPKEHFKTFTKTKSKNGKPFLTDIQFNEFIQKAFCGKDYLKQRFNQAPKGEKLLIQTVFYEFYNNYCFDYFNTTQCQERFIKILTDNFEGWNFKNVKENFTPKTRKRL